MPSQRKHNSPAQRQAAYRQRQAQAREDERREKGLPTLPAIATLPGERRWAVMLQQARLLVATVVEERERYHNDRSEAWQQSERGSDFEERTGAIAEVMDALDELETP